jgi:acetyl-CoA synthetase
MADNFDVKLSEKYYTPDPSYKQNSWLGDYQKAYDDFLKDPMSGPYRPRIPLVLPYSKVKEWNYPHTRWFTGGKMNITTTA